MKVIAITPDRKYDYMVAIIIEGLYDYGAEIIASDFGNGVRDEDVYHEADVIRHAADADYIFTFFGKVRDNRPPKFYLLDHINRPDITAYIDGSEWTYTGWTDVHDKVFCPVLNENTNRQAYEARRDYRRYRGQPWINDDISKKVSWYFKRECYKEDLENGIIPISFGAEKKCFVDHNLERDIDILISFGQLHTGLRYEVTQESKRLMDTHGYNVKIISGVPFNEYQVLLSRSKIVVSSWGGGNNCMRMLEGLAAGACTFIQHPAVEFVDLPVDMHEAVLYSSMKEFTEKIHVVLGDLEKCGEIAKNGKALAITKHTGIARLNYMLDKMGNNQEIR